MKSQGMKVPTICNIFNEKNKVVDIAKKNGIKDEVIGQWRTEIIKQAADVAFSKMKDAVWFMKKEYTLTAALAVLQDYMKVSGINADHRIETGKKHVFVIQHELGENWSLFTKELLRLIFENLAQATAQVKRERMEEPSVTRAAYEQAKPTRKTSLHAPPFLYNEELSRHHKKKEQGK